MADETATAAAKAPAPHTITPPPNIGHGEVVWDDPKLDPTKRKNLLQDPDGTANAKVVG